MALQVLSGFVSRFQPPLPEEDYPTFSEEQDGEVSPNLLVEDYSTVKRDRIPRVKLDTDTPEGWSCEIDKDGQMCYTSNYTQEQVKINYIYPFGNALQ